MQIRERMQIETITEALTNNDVEAINTAIAYLQEVARKIQSEQNAKTPESKKDGELESYIKNIFVFKPENYKFLKDNLDPKKFEKTCISLIGGKNYNIFKMQEAGIKCPHTVPLTTNFYFDLIGPEIQDFVANIFQDCGGQDNIYYPHHEYTSKNIEPISKSIKEKIINVKLSDKCEKAIQEAYITVGGYEVDKICRSAKVAEDSPNASFAGCGDSNAQLIQPTKKEDYELFRLNVILVAASGFNFVGIENMLRMQAENGSNYNPKRDPMAQTLMPFIYPENYRELSNEDLINRVSAAYIFHNQLGYDGRQKIKMQITNGTGATIADSCPGLPLVTVDKKIYMDMSSYKIHPEPVVEQDTTIYYATNENGERIEFLQIFTPEQKTCYLINKDFNYKDSQSSRKIEVEIPSSVYKPAFDIQLIFRLLGVVDNINNNYPKKNMESEYAMIKDGNEIEIQCVQTRPITVKENALIGEIPALPDSILEFTRICEVYSTGAAEGTAYNDKDMPDNTSDLGQILYVNTTITQEDAPQYKKPNIVAFIEEWITGAYTHGAVQGREMEIPVLSGIGGFMETGKKYFVFAYPNARGKGMAMEVNEQTNIFIDKLKEFHQVQVENAFKIRENLESRPLKYFELGMNITSTEIAKKFGKNGKGVKNCTLYRPNVGLAEKFQDFDFLSPETDPKFAELGNYLEEDIYNASKEFDTFNYRHLSPQLNEHFGKNSRKMQKLIYGYKIIDSSLKLKKITGYGDDKFSAMQGSTLTCEYPDFFEKIEIIRIKNVLERLKQDDENIKIKFTIEFPKSAGEVNKMFRMMEKVGLHEYKNLSVGPMIENVQMAMDVENIDFGKFTEDQVAFSFATNDLAAMTQGIDRQKGQNIVSVYDASSNPNPVIEIIKVCTTKIKAKWPNADISICGEIVATLDPYIAAILYNLGIKIFAMPSSPNKFGKVFEAMHLFETLIDPKTGKIEMPQMVRLNLKS